MLSLREFARLAGVSRTTVSRAFARDGRIAAATRERIMALAVEHDFRPSPVLRPVARMLQTESVGVLHPDFHASYFQDMRTGIQCGLLDEGFLPIMLGVQPANLRTCLNRLVDHRVDGFIVSVWDKTLDPTALSYLTSGDRPVVCLSAGAATFLPNADSVDTDDVAGGAAAARHLIALGHRRVGVIVHEQLPNRRLDGFREVITKAGFWRPEWLISGHGRERMTFHAELVKLLSTNPRPSAIFAGTDIEAAVVYQVAAQLGLTIPHDLSVVGYADLKMAPLMAPPLTTVLQDGLAVGRAAATTIIERIRGATGQPCERLIPTELVVRASTAPPTDR